MKRINLLGAALLAFSASAAAAQDGPPDPASVQLPPMTFGTDPAVAKDGYKFFFFHHPQLTYAEAVQDFAECQSLLPFGEGLPLPGFVPWVEANNRKVIQRDPQYGLVGAAIGAILLPKLARGQRNNKMRLCMERRGYVRYAVNEAAYDALWEGTPEEISAKQALLATGPAPAAAVQSE